MGFLKDERDRFAAFAFASANILMELDESGGICYADGAIESLLGREPTTLKNQNFQTIVLESDRDLAEYRITAAVNARVQDVAVRLIGPDGKPVMFIASGYRIPELSNHLFLTLSVYKGQLNVQDLSRRDNTTGLLLKGEFSNAANRQVATSKVSNRVPVMTMLVLQKLNELKNSHDSKDYDRLNHVLREINALLKSYSIDGDAVGMIDQDTIGFVHDKTLDTEEIKSRIGQIIAHSELQPGAITMKSVTILLDSQGISEEDSAHAILYTLNKFARNKGEGFNLRSISESYHQMVSETVGLITDFRRITSSSNFNLAFQPIVDVRSYKIEHFEVLVRLNDSSTFKNPASFISFGEQAGIIVDFDLSMAQKALTVMDNIAASGVEVPSLSINLSGKSLSSSLFMDSLYLLLRKHRRICNKVVFEITESAKIADPKITNSFFKDMRKLGVKFSIDDFGTGECSFGYLREFKIDYLKIDGSYVNDRTLSPAHSKHLLKSIAGLCKNMGIKSIGEKVEDKDGERLLRHCGVDLGQGYYYGKPLVEKDFLTNYMALSQPLGYQTNIIPINRPPEERRHSKPH